MENKELEMAKEVARIYVEKKDYKEAYREVEEMYKKNRPHSDQTNEGEHIKILNDILSDKVDIDNGYICDNKTGKTIGELI